MRKHGNRVRDSGKLGMTYRAVDDFIIAAGSGTGCLNNLFLHRRVFLMPCCRNRFGLCGFAPGTGFCQDAICSTGRCCGNDAFVPIVTQCLDDSNLCYIVADAAMSGLAALRGTGRLFVHREVFGIIMAQSF